MAEIRDTNGLSNSEAAAALEPISEEDILSQARKDAQIGLSAADPQGLTQFETHLLCVHQENANSIAHEYLTRLEELKAEIVKKERAIENKYAEDIKMSDTMYSSQRKTLEESSSLEDRRREFDQFEKEFERIRVEADRLPSGYFSTKHYRVFQAVIFVGLVFLNAFVFHFWPRSDWRNWLIASGAAAVSIVLAHFAGVRLRRRQTEKGSSFLGIGAFVVALLFFWSLASYRGSILIKSDDTSLLVMLLEGNLLFFWQNVSLFSGLALIAFLYSDPWPGYTRAYLNMKKAKAQLRQSEHGYHTQIEKLDLEKASRENGAAKMHGVRQDQLVDLRCAYNNLLREGQERERGCAVRLAQDFSLYRRECVAAGGEGDLQFLAAIPEIERRLVDIAPVGSS